MQEEQQLISPQKRFIALTHILRGEPVVPSSKYYTLRYLLAAICAEGESRIAFPAESDDSDALFRGCRALGARLVWENEQHSNLRVHGVGRVRQTEPVTINVGNAGAVLRLLLGIGATSSEITYITDHPQSLGKRPNRELLEALTMLGVGCEGTGPEGYLPITLHGGNIHGGHIKVSGARSSQYLSALLFLAPLIGESVDIEVIDGLKSQPLVLATLEVLHEAGVTVEQNETLTHFAIAAGQQYSPRTYTIPGDYPSAATWLAACAVSNNPSSEIQLARLRQGDEVGEELLAAFHAMGADVHRVNDTVSIRGGQPLHNITVDGDHMGDCIPVLVAAACFAEGESIFYNIESLHYKESDRIEDLCAELRRVGCTVTPKQDAIIVQGSPQGIEGGVTVDGHNDHRVLMALSIVATRSRLGLTLTGTEHISKSYPHFFEELQRMSIDVI